MTNLTNPEFYRLRIGGVLRCCAETLNETVFESPPKEGDTLHCKYHTDEISSLIFRDGAWEWNKEGKIP